jgi:hypothetical protein
MLLPKPQPNIPDPELHPKQPPSPEHHNYVGRKSAVRAYRLSAAPWYTYTYLEVLHNTNMKIVQKNTFLLTQFTRNFRDQVAVKLIKKIFQPNEFLQN